jgi:hypothetical protein
MKGTLYNIPLSGALTQVNGGPDDRLVPGCLVARLFVEDARAKGFQPVWKLAYFEGCKYWMTPGPTPTLVCRPVIISRS